MHVNHLLARRRVERQHLLPNGRVERLGVIVGRLGADAARLVDLFGLLDGGLEVRIDLARDGLVGADDALPDLVVERGDVGEEAGRDALLVCRGRRVSARCGAVKVLDDAGGHGRTLTVHLDRALDNVVAEDVAVCEVYPGRALVVVSPAVPRPPFLGHPHSATIPATGLSSCSSPCPTGPLPTPPAPIAVPGVAPLGNAPVAGVAAACALLTSRCAPSSVPPLSMSEVRIADSFSKTRVALLSVLVTDWSLPQNEKKSLSLASVVSGERPVTCGARRGERSETRGETRGEKKGQGEESGARRATNRRQGATRTQRGGKDAYGPVSRLSSRCHATWLATHVNGVSLRHDGQVIC